MKEYNLKPCPFCNGDAELCWGGNGDARAKGMAFVKCKECGAIGRKVILDYNYCTNDEAVKAWNERREDDKE